jgi:hypothetical protein
MKGYAPLYEAIAARPGEASPCPFSGPGLKAWISTSGLKAFIALNTCKPVTEGVSTSKQPIKQSFAIDMPSMYHVSAQILGVDFDKRRLPPS